MARQIDKPTYQETITCIREIILDLQKVFCFDIEIDGGGADFTFVKDSSSVTVMGTTELLTEVPKFYNLLELISDTSGIKATVRKDYVATEFTSSLVDVDHTAETEKQTISRSRYFSDQQIERKMEDYYAQYLPYTDQIRLSSEIFTDLDYFGIRKMCYWVAYYLLDEKRKNYAAVDVTLTTAANNGDYCEDESQLKQRDDRVTMMIGDSFEVTEQTKETGKDLEGFTALWADNYSYLTKLQLWIRQQYERLFQDYSLRDNVMVSQSTTLEKHWRPFVYVDTKYLSSFTQDFFLPPRQVQSWGYSDNVR
jgi:hypothetical protein